MTGVLAVREKAVWNMQGWIYDNFLERLSEELRPDDQQLATILHDVQIIQHGIGYCDISHLEVDRFRRLVQATDRAYDLTTQLGPGSFRTPLGFTTFMAGASELKLLLRTDPRSGEAFDRDATLVISEDEVWTASAWVFDFVLEAFASELQISNSHIALTMLSARTCVGGGHFDLRLLETEDLYAIRETTNLLYSHHRTGKGLHSDTPPLNLEVAAYVIELKALLT